MWARFFIENDLFLVGTNTASSAKPTTPAVARSAIENAKAYGTQKTVAEGGTGSHGLTSQQAGSAESAKLKTEIALLRARIQSLERSENRLKQQIRDKLETMKDMKVEMDQAKNEALEAEERREETTVHVQELERDLEKYQGWWLTDYYSLKVVLGLVPNKQDVKHIALASRARFKEHTRVQ